MKKTFILITLSILIVSCMPNTNPMDMGNNPSMMSATSTPGSMTMMEGMGGHSMEPITGTNIEPATDNIGGQPLTFREEDGVKVFELTAKVVQWEIMEGVTINAMTFNGTVPGPMIRVTEGDQVRVIVKNELDEPTTVHWHGVEVPNAMDGVPNMTQDPIQPGETFTYEFTAKPAGTYMYHSHYESDTQVLAGLYAPLIIDPITPEENPPAVDEFLMISEVLLMGGQTFPAMPMSGMEPNYFLINGKSFPATQEITIKKGETLRLRIAAIGQFIHPMHLHGPAFNIVATDGHPVPEATQLTKDTVSVAPGERYDIEWVATETGMWMLHCHIPHHTTNNGEEPGGLMLVINVTE